MSWKALLALALTVAIPQTPVHRPEHRSGTTYYLDAGTGDDADSGRGPRSAWRTLDRVNTTTFHQGDRILLRSGQSWTGQLWPKGSGAAGRPIVVDRYGPGAKPRIDGAGVVADAVRLFNQEHWTIRNLEITNANPPTGMPGENLRDLRGLHVGGDNSQILDGFVIDAVDVHDVTGEVNWISGDPAESEPGMNKGTGWDRSKRTGGIVLDTTVPDPLAPPETPTILNDVLVQNSTVRDTSFAGIVVKQYTGDKAVPTGWGTRTSATDPAFAPHTDVTIRNNFITQSGTAYGCNGIYLTDVRGAVVEHNVVHRTGTSGIESYFSDDVTIQFNEVYETTAKAGGADSNGIDPDKGTTRHLVQYNYVHHNGDGILLCQFVFGDVVVRENVIASNSRHQIYLHSDRAARAQIYHNTVHNDRSNFLIYGYGSSLNATYEVRNNVLSTTRPGAVLTTSPTITYDANLYSDAAVPGDARAIVADPLFLNPAVTGPYGTAASGPELTTAHAFRVRAASPAIDTGTAIPDDGGRDFAGVPRVDDRGAFEYATPPGATTETIAGFVRDPNGVPLSGAVVAVGARTTTTAANGWYALPDVPFAASVIVTATRDGYSTGQADIAVSARRATLHFTLTSTSTVGRISGQVQDQTGQPVAGAVITVQGAVAETRSAADGTFTLVDVPVGDDHTITATRDGLAPATRDGLDVTAATTTPAGTLILLADVPDERDLQTFDDLPDGPLATGTNGLTVSHSGGAVEVVGGHLRLTRSADSGGTSVVRAFDPPLKGLVTVEGRVMRDDPYVSGNHWFGVPYLRGTSGVNAVSVAFDRGRIVAYSGTGTVTLGDYELGRWYHVQCVVDVANRRFDLLVDGTTVLSRAALRAPMDGVAQVEYFANSSNYGQVHLDDFRVYQGRR
ncbi:carboxypeptidase regulatory-like domain-containing protein [Actinoplanes rectilineatus]|uniref:carboxypeptidase regulatory-like domain-containing protein n=1 Tax=Actinoplanes rectilineatus TaxID=113571 RepID=UPI0007C81EAF|nr:carboxypeptidase regulatory-like domain-containing protein [Actinoplanes rectilineatus]